MVKKIAPRKRSHSGVMKAMKSKKSTTKQTAARLDTWTRGVIWGMHLAGMKREDMRDHVRKKDGSKLTLHTLDDVIKTKTDHPDWKGEDSSAGGRPKALTKAQEQQVVKLVFQCRGKDKVTIPYCKKVFKWLREIDDGTVANVLHRAGLKWLTRRQKSWVPQEHKESRVTYSTAVLRKHSATLQRQAYTDGTAWYLARSVAEKEDKKTLALGKHVWREATGKDGLFGDNIGPSLYAKAQGLPVKIWGFFARGRLEYWVLPMDPDDGRKTTHMNGQTYNKLIKDKFSMWRRACFGDNELCHLIQDHERCLWNDDNLTALRQAGCPVVADFPKCSPDLNAIEGMWKILRDRMYATEPAECESRADFLIRLRRAVHWLNEHNWEYQRYLCCNQKDIIFSF